jgi:hypothetical protein
MRRLQRSQWLIALLCALLILARVGGAHWHLCTDHSSPVLSVQGAVDTACYSEQAQHHDVDLDTTKSAVAKIFKGFGLDLPLLAMLVFAWLWSSIRPVVPLPPYTTPAVIRTALLRHASPRAPPF